MNIIQERIFRDYMTGKYSYDDLSIKYSMSRDKVCKYIQTHKEYDKKKIKQIGRTRAKERTIIAHSRKDKGGYSDEDRRRKEALDRGYERSLRLGIPWTIAEMERSLKHGTAKI